MRALLLLLALNAPILGAQSLAPALPDEPPQSGSLQLEAVWLLTPSDSAASPLERLVNPAALPSQHSGLRREKRNQPTLGASLTLDRGTPAMALLCRSGAPLVSLGAMAEHCLLAQIEAPADLMGGTLRSAQTELNWNLPDSGLDLNFGLYWLRPESSTTSLGMGPAGSGLAWSSTQFLPELRGLSIGASKSFFVGEELKLILGGSLAHQELRLPGLPTSLDSNLLDLSLALEGNAFSGVLNSRHYAAENGGSRWQAVDLGIAWRTPWQGQLSVGARNLLGRSAPAALTPAQALGFGADSSLLDEPSQGRVPFVRYRQDL